MKVKKIASLHRNKLLLGCLVLVVLAAGYANIKLTNNSDANSEVNANAEGVVADGTTETSEDYFAVFRTERETVREQEINYIDAIVSSTETDADTKKEAQDQKLSLVTCMEQELTTEGLIKSKLSMDAVVTVKDGSVSVVVGKKSLTDSEVAQIADIVKEQTGQSAQNIKIMPQS